MIKKKKYILTSILDEELPSDIEKRAANSLDRIAAMKRQMKLDEENDKKREKQQNLLNKL
jgi:hypothetical protein